MKSSDESHRGCEQSVYSEAILEKVRQTPQGQKLVPIELGDEYLKEAGRVARERVFVAGKRLGSLLRGRVRVPSALLTEKSGGLDPYAAALRHSLALVGVVRRLSSVGRC